MFLSLNVSAQCLEFEPEGWSAYLSEAESVHCQESRYGIKKEVLQMRLRKGERRGREGERREEEPCLRGGKGGGGGGSSSSRPNLEVKLLLLLMHVHSSSSSSY